MRNYQIGVLALTALSLTSCASALKRQCKSTNWHEHGAAIAKSGRRVDADTFVQQCEREEAPVDRAALSVGFRKGLEEYCTPEFAYRVARQGDYLAQDMCAPDVERRMKAKHAEGLKDYCQPSNGQSAGGSGKKYNHICPKDLEKDFLVEFNKGRKNFLTITVQQKRSEIESLDREIGDIEREKAEKRFEIQRLDQNRTLSYKQTRDPQTGSQTKEISMQRQKEVEDSIQSLQWELRSLDGKISNTRERQRQLSTEIREAEAESVTLN